MCKLCLSSIGLPCQCLTCVLKWKVTTHCDGQPHFKYDREDYHEHIGHDEASKTWWIVQHSSMNIKSFRWFKSVTKLCLRLMFIAGSGLCDASALMTKWPWLPPAPGKHPLPPSPPLRAAHSFILLVTREREREPASSIITGGRRGEQIVGCGKS